MYVVVKDSLLYLIMLWGICGPFCKLKLWYVDLGIRPYKKLKFIHDQRFQFFFIDNMKKIIYFINWRQGIPKHKFLSCLV
mgnify:CR=1 FL=1